MTKITIYQKPTCRTCRRVHAALKDSGVDFKAVDYYTDPISKTKIKRLLSKMNMQVADLLRKREGVYKELGLAKKKLSKESLLDLMVKYPDLIERPIVEKGEKAILARPAERILDILSTESK
ncbi:MAG: arsenate reductase [Candidatus Omnitrophica bacterium]|nr:arsenate reductase [Candidatus Omnitrophota bacterium]